MRAAADSLIKKVAKGIFGRQKSLLQFFYLFKQSQSAFVVISQSTKQLATGTFLQVKWRELWIRYAF